MTYKYLQLRRETARRYQIHQGNFLFIPWYAPLQSPAHWEHIHQLIMQEVAKQVAGNPTGAFNSTIDWASVIANVTTIVLSIVCPAVAPFSFMLEPVIEAIVRIMISLIQEQLASRTFGASPLEFAACIQQLSLEATALGGAV